MSAPKEKRARFFIGGEGKSEKAYGQYIQDVAWEENLPVTFELCDCGGGDPLVVINKAIRECNNRDSVDYPFKGKFLLIDSDRLEDMSSNDVAKIMKLLSCNNFTPIWQDPDHEGFLLRHFIGHENDCPSRGQSWKALLGVWPDYGKGRSRRDYYKKITLDDVRRVAKRHPKLKFFLQEIGLVKADRRSRRR